MSYSSVEWDWEFPIGWAERVWGLYLCSQTVISTRGRHSKSWALHRNPSLHSRCYQTSRNRTVLTREKRERLFYKPWFFSILTSCSFSSCWWYVVCMVCSTTVTNLGDFPKIIRVVWFDHEHPVNAPAALYDESANLKKRKKVILRRATTASDISGRRSVRFAAHLSNAILERIWRLNVGTAKWHVSLVIHRFLNACKHVCLKSAFE